MVQLPEPTKHPKYPTISSITRERARRAIAKNGGVDSDNTTSDYGFRAFRLTRSHFKVWNGDLGPGDTAALDAALDLFADSRAPDADPEAMLFELLLKSGISLTAPVATHTAPTGQTFYAVENGALLFCLDDPIEPDTLRHLISQSPRKIVCLDAAFGGSDALKTNLLLEARAADVTLETV